MVARGRSSNFLDRLGIRYPIIQAPMGGGPTTPALVAAVSGAGGLGFLAAGYLDPEAVREEITHVRQLTDRPFGVNAFVDGSTDGARDTAPMLELLGTWAARLGIEKPNLPAPVSSSLEAVVDLVIELGIPVFSVTFGVPEQSLVGALRRHGTVVLGTATTVEEALLLEATGVDAVVVQGAEAGAHRATFLEPLERGLVGTMALVPQVVDAIDLPVVASGGIMDGRGIAAALALGAAAVQMGTAFLFADEAAVPDAYLRRLLTAREDETSITRVFSGRPARGIRNRFMEDLETAAVPVPPFPLQNSLTRPLRKAAAAQGDAEVLSLWAGQGVRMGKRMPAGRLVQVLVRELEGTLERLTQEQGTRA